MAGILEVIRRLLAVLLLTAIVAAAYWFLARPYQLRWGATQAELARDMPGDDLIEDPTFDATRAITIRARPAEIWPWLLQMGHGRAGFYGFDLLENLGSPTGLRSADRILPEYQSVSVGDPVPTSAIHSMKLAAIEPDRYLVWAGEDGEGGFTWALYPQGPGSTRLVSRIRWRHHSWPPGLVVIEIFTELADHLAVREILQGVKGRVEGEIEASWHQDLEFGLYTLSAVIFLAGIVVVAVRPFKWVNWLVALGAGAAWLLTWFARLPHLGGCLLVGAACTTLLWSPRQAAQL